MRHVSVCVSTDAIVFVESCCSAVSPVFHIDTTRRRLQQSLDAVGHCARDARTGCEVRSICICNDPWDLNNRDNCTAWVGVPRDLRDRRLDNSTIHYYDELIKEDKVTDM
jgi:hypothetical protein